MTVIQFSKQIQSLSNSDLATELAEIRCELLLDSLRCQSGAIALRNNIQSERLAISLGQIAVQNENRNALILLEAMKRISTKDL